ncbi:MAG: tail fiber domain-containing protein [Ferruginibacter sp.]
MKQLIFINYFCFMLLFISRAQDVAGIGTLTALGKLHVKGTNDTAQLVIQAFTPQSPQQSLLRFIRSNGDSLLSLHSFSDNIWMGKYIGTISTRGYKNIYLGKYIDLTNGNTPYQNIFIGDFAGESVGNGHDNIGIGNDVFKQQTNPINMVCIGSQAANILVPNANENTAIGYKALHSDFGAGADNTAIGANTMLFTVGANQSVAIGNFALYGYTGVGANSATLNTAIGVASLYTTKTGSYNTGVGSNVLGRNYSGQYNSALGYKAFYSTNMDNTSNENVAVGYQSLNIASAGTNTAIGMEALYSSSGGNKNVAIGMRSLYINGTGYENVAVGYQALFSTSNSIDNTAVGSQSGDTYNNGVNNVFIGALTDVAGADMYNAIAIGQGTVAPAPSYARFGNSSTTSYGGWANWTNVSDGRFKTNVQENVPGLLFIMKLRPVTYHLQAKALDDHQHEGLDKHITEEAKAVMNKALAEKEKITYSGFIAQEVETSAKSLGFDFSGVDAPTSSKDVYGLRYEEFVVPLVRAVKEQQQMLDTDDNRITSLQQQLEALKARLRNKAMHNK